MSPDAPALIAQSGDGPPISLPRPTKSNSALPTGVAFVVAGGAFACVWPEVGSFSSHSTLPLDGSWLRTPLPAAVAISVRILLRQMNGVLQFDFSSRATRHSSLPVFLSKAARNDFSSLSQRM